MTKLGESSLALVSLGLDVRGDGEPVRQRELNLVAPESHSPGLKRPMCLPHGVGAVVAYPHRLFFPQKQKFPKPQKEAITQNQSKAKQSEAKQSKQQIQEVTKKKAKMKAEFLQQS